MFMPPSRGVLKRCLLIISLFILLLSIQGCGVTKSYHPLPDTLESKVQMKGFTNVRSWADTYSSKFESNAREALKEERKYYGKLNPEMSMLALSGGGSDGAFGAGFLCGWSKTGKRPIFKVVTGISTGGLIAPFAFLGPRYDAKLKEVYTTISDDQIYSPYSLFSVFMSIIQVNSLPSLASNEPLAKLIEKDVTMSMLKEIAAEQHKGRRLLIGTTQFNAQRLVLWNMGEIAEVGTPEALKLFQKIMLASAALPVSFTPVYFDVEAEGKMYQEMHVDGGIEAQVMLYENAILPFSNAKKSGNRVERRRKIYIIRNQQIYPEWEYVKPTLKDIAVRSIDSLTKSQGMGDLYRLFTYARRDNMEYNLTFIPDSFTEKAKTPFDNTYMRHLFALGYQMGIKDDSWKHYPPGYDPD